MQTLGSASNQALKTIAKTKFERVITSVKNYHNVMRTKYGDAFNPHGDDTILSVINDMTSFIEVVEKNNVFSKQTCDKVYSEFVLAYSEGK
tara:strand:+ start:63 stop:335 length:273 start_codon:yes stop_codon:yes gene_type:complete